jgi:predicted dehydrogenase
MKKLTGAIIGCGAIAREHLSSLRESRDAEIAAVCDLSPARAEATADRFGIAKWYCDYQDMLAHVRPDLVHITTPPSSHFSIARSCLSAGLNVFCEKPITADYQQFGALKKLAVENRCMLMENLTLRFHSTVQRLDTLLKSGAFGDLLDVQVCYLLDLNAPNSPFADPNAPHFGQDLPGGVIGDFLPHIAYLTYIFTGPVLNLRTIWGKHTTSSILPADEFRAAIKGERATAYVAFIGNAQPPGLWLRLSGTRMHAEANLLAPPRLTFKRVRTGEPGLATMLDGIVEARDVLSGTIAGFWRKLSGASNYDGLSEMIAQTYRAVGLGEPQPIALDHIDDVARLVDSFTKPELKL